MDKINLMEICGTHTMAIAKSGIKSILPEHIQLLSGPGCPVCVTPPEVIDAVLNLTENKSVVLATYGDMMKVPGSRKGDSLMKRKAQGAQVEVVYSPMDSVELAKEHPEKEIVFLGVGFETTAPGTAACIKEAKAAGLENYSVFNMLKRVEPALRTLIESPDFNVHGFLCPGHVAVIIGEAGFRFLTEEYHIPAVVAGFEPTEILSAIKCLLNQIASGMPKLENAYQRAVMPEGNKAALEILEEVFETGTSSWRAAPVCTAASDFETAGISPAGYQDIWRGLGMIPGSGFQIRDTFATYDAVKKFDIRPSSKAEPSTCRCGDVICGRLAPNECPMFGTVCTPADPEGPCMVSSEGACAAAYLYGEII